MIAIIPHTNGKYAVTDKGEVISFLVDINGKKLKGYETEGGYLHVSLKMAESGKFVNHYIHRLVAQAFIPNPDNLPCINHRDENPANNCVENLEWCDYKYNNNFGRHNEKLAKANKLGGVPRRVAKIDNEGNTVWVYYSLKEAARSIDKDNWNSITVQLSKVCNKTKGHHTVCGWRWKFIDDEEYVATISANPEMMPTDKYSRIHLKNYRIREYVEKTIRKYNPKTGEITKIVEREVVKKNTENSVALF